MKQESLQKVEGICKYYDQLGYCTHPDIPKKKSNILSKQFSSTRREKEINKLRKRIPPFSYPISSGAVLCNGNSFSISPEMAKAQAENCPGWYEKGVPRTIILYPRRVNR